MFQDTCGMYATHPPFYDFHHFLPHLPWFPLKTTFYWPAFVGDRFKIIPILVNSIVESVFCSLILYILTNLSVRSDIILDAPKTLTFNLSYNSCNYNWFDRMFGMIDEPNWWLIHLIMIVIWTLKNNSYYA